jgi:hypothetical protein
MKPNYTSFILLLVGVLLLVLNETLMAGQIPSWVFILILIAWIGLKVRDLRNMRK